MSVQMIQARLDLYSCRSTLEEEQALREITQEIVLAGLGRTDIFKQAGFQGGTCLRGFSRAGPILGGSRFRAAQSGPGVRAATLLANIDPRIACLWL